MKSAREIWTALECKYKAEEEGTNKYLIAKYFDFKMVDTKPVVEQVHELQVIVNKICGRKIILPKSFQVGAIRAKLPPSWKDYGKKFLHKSEDITLEQIQKHLRIEEESRLRDTKNLMISETNVNFVEGSTSKVKNPNLQANKNVQFKKKNSQKKNGACFVCEKPGHYAKQCRYKKNPPVMEKANMVEEQHFLAMISEINMATVKSGWWFDSSSTVHVCNDK
ncbi:zf-CCHC domain-containing protein/UBN2_2 domain-containing protein [Cephalotus follicularis]|uniref:Zf-CCHC domain-containing protein/UBN2_2 domain-containing protein n=1 Tax=Cephalotus follicularis TaxID=3775 RepID=A0A1Q3CYP3_CEPFO|nr:zf-CCHC domain-containing protein/UBN2_2 domain-containing protein [Cephalotus follicularis]